MRRVLALLTRLVSVLFAWLPFCGRRERLVGGAGKRVLVSGCDSGIGLRLAQRLHEAGYRVLAGCLSTDSEGARQLSKLRDRQHPVQVLQLDVTSDSSVQRALVQGRVHDEGLCGLVNNAGVCVLGEFEWMTPEQVERTMAVNLLGTMRLTKACLPYIRRSKGRVVCLSTVVAAAPAMPCMSAYCASKTAVESFTRCLRLELARHGAHAIVVRPGDLAKHTGIMKRQGDDNEVSLGNRLFVSDDIPLLPEFKETLAETFSVDLGRMNFKENPQAAAQEINAWAAKATDGNLTHLLRDGDVSENTRILMVSAIYFRGVFSEPFCGPVKAPFYVNARETAQVDMMESCRGALYCRSTRIPCEAIELSYVCRTLSLLIILPDKGVPLSKLVAALSNDVVRRLMKDLKPVQSMAVWMPRFRLQNSYSMVPALKAIGITHLFDDHVVDLSRMTGKSTGLAVDNFVHEALFETSEEGVGEATRPPEPLDASVITFRANRPFLYVLLHHYNHAVVFMGAVCRP